MDVDGLYGLPLDRFVPERRALARALRAQGRREEATVVAALRKPSVAAWAVNQVVRTQARQVGELFDAGDALRDAQARLVAGDGDRDALRAATRREREAVDVLAGAARGLLTFEGHELSCAIIERVADTLHAAALDDDARRQLNDGRLQRELRHVWLGGLSRRRQDARPTARAPRRSPSPRRVVGRWPLAAKPMRHPSRTVGRKTTSRACSRSFTRSANASAAGPRAGRTVRDVELGARSGFLLGEGLRK